MQYENNSIGLVVRISKGLVMKNKLLIFIGLLIFHYGYGSEIDFDCSDTESVSSKSSERGKAESGLFHEEGHVSGSSSSSSSDSSESDDSHDSGVVQDKIIDKTWGLKNLLSATPDHDLYRSPLLGLITVGNGTIKKWYGTFSDVPAGKQEVGKPARNKRVFTTEMLLEKVTRSFFDILDGRVRCSVAGSNPMIALSAEAVGQLVVVAHDRGISGMITFLEEGLVRKQKQKKQSALGENVKLVLPGESFIDTWWARYELRSEKGKFTDQRDFRKRLMVLCKDLSLLQQEQGPKKTKELFLTVLMAFLVLKDEAEGQKNPAYTVQDYFKKLGVEYVRDYYTTVEKKAIQKRLGKRSFGTSVKDFEEVVFYFSALAKNDFEFVGAPYTSALFKEVVKGEETEVAHGLCAEATVRSFLNLMLYNPTTQRFDVGMLPEGIHLDPLVYDFYFNPEHPRTDPQAPRYYGESADAWIQVIVALHKKFPAIVYKQNELAGKPQNMLLVINKIFGTVAQSFEELGNILSKDGSQIIIETAESDEKPGDYYKKEKWTIAVERDGLPGEDPYEFFVNLELSDGHAAFLFDMENIMPLMGKHQYRLVEELQKIYHVDLWSMVLNAGAINAVIDDETPFQEAVQSGCVPLVKLLISHGADIYQVDDDHLGALGYAYQSGSDEMVQFFTDQGLKINASLESITSWLWGLDQDVDDQFFDQIIASNVTDHGQQKKDFYSTALMVCLDRNWVERAKKLIKEGANINFIEVPDEGQKMDRAPIVAAARGCADEALANLLVDALEPVGDDRNRAQAYGWALGGFYIKKYRYAVKVLLEKGADTNVYSEFPNADSTLPSYVTGVVVDVSVGDDELLMQRVVDALPLAGENKTLARLYGNALIGVLLRGWNDIGNILIEKGADINFYNELSLNLNRTPWGVVLAASYSQDQNLMKKIVDALNPAGENKVLVRSYGEALENVVNKGWFDIAVQLVEKGASLDGLCEYQKKDLEQHRALLEKKCNRLFVS